MMPDDDGYLKRRTAMQYLLMLHAEGWLGTVDKGTATTRGGGIYGVWGGAETGWRASRIKPAAAEFGGDDGACGEWQAAGGGWSVRGVQGADWRLLSD